MKQILLILTLLIFQANSFGQQKGFHVKAFVSDSVSGEPIANAGIVISGTNIATQSGINGQFSLWIAKAPVTLKISHLGYYEKFIKIEYPVADAFNISLSKKINMLPELAVTMNKPVNIIEDQPLYIKDYEFVNDKIIVLAYKDKMYSKAFLYLMNQDGDTLCSVRLKKTGKLYKDCFDNNHLITKSEAWQILTDSAGIDFIYPEDLEAFEEAMLPVVEELNGKYFFEKYYYNNQLLQYYYFDKKSSEVKQLKVIIDESKAYMLKDRARIIAGSDNPEMQARFEDLAFFKPVFAPLIKIHDTLCIFNYTDSTIEFYTDSCVIIKEIPISFQNNKYWKREIFVDDAKGKVYALFRKDGISTIKEINLRNGELTNSIVVPEFPFIDKIKINNNIIYFLYTDHADQADYKRLYRMKI